MLRFSFAALFLFLNSTSAYMSTPAAYGVGKTGFDEYRQTLPSDFDVVAAGGWSALHKRYLSEVGTENFHLSKSTLPEDIPVVAAGGYSSVAKLAADPKAELVTLIIDNLRYTGGKGSYGDFGKIDAIVALLQSQGKGFVSDKVDGEWVEVLTRQGAKSRASQKIIGGAKKKSRPNSDFDVSKMEFINEVLTPRGNGKLVANVKYNPVKSNYDKSPDGKVVLRRIACDITGANFKYGKFPKLSLPFLKRKGGYLDFLYLDEDIRVTKGNRGGLFVHFRPGYYQQVFSN